jgi:hypothetical protein
MKEKKISREGERKCYNKPIGSKGRREERGEERDRERQEGGEEGGEGEEKKGR